MDLFAREQKPATPLLLPPEDFTSMLNSPSKSSGARPRLGGDRSRRTSTSEESSPAQSSPAQSSPVQSSPAVPAKIRIRHDDAFHGHLDIQPEGVTSKRVISAGESPSKSWDARSCCVDDRSKHLTRPLEESSRAVLAKTHPRPRSKRKRVGSDRMEGKKKSRSLPGTSCFVSYFLKAGFRSSLAYQLASKFRLKPAPGVVLTMCGGLHFKPQIRANTRGVLVNVFEYNKKGVLELKTYSPTNVQARAVEMFATYTKEGSDLCHYPLAPCTGNEVVPNACEVCARQCLGRECEEFQGFASDFEKHGFTSDMEYFLSNWREWKQYIPSTGDDEVVRVLAAIRSFHRTFNDDLKKIDRIAAESLDYFRKKHLKIGKVAPHRQCRTKPRWSEEVAPHRQCRAKDANGNRCMCGKIKGKVKAVFGRHGGVHRFRKPVQKFLS